MDRVLSLHTPLVWTKLIVIGCCSSKNKLNTITGTYHSRISLIFAMYWTVQCEFCKLDKAVKLSRNLRVLKTRVGQSWHRCSEFFAAKKTIKKELAAGAGHEAICITKELIVFKDLPEQRKLKEPKNQLTESCKFVNLWKS